jgi:hypothetical protein
LEREGASENRFQDDRIFSLEPAYLCFGVNGAIFSGRFHIDAVALFLKTSRSFQISNGSGRNDMKFLATSNRSFEGFYAGPAMAAFVLTAGIRACVAGVGGPLSSLVIDELDYLVKRSYPDIASAAGPALDLSASIGWVMSGIILLALGMVLALWLTSSAKKPAR